MKKKILMIIITLILFTIILLLLQRGIIMPNKIEAQKYEVNGIDLSEYQGKVDWKLLAKQDINFAFIKTTEGSSTTDSHFVENFQGASQTDLVLGAYHFFSYDSDGISQANLYINALEIFEDIDNIIIPIVDVEFYGDKEKNLPDVAETQKQLKAFLSLLEEKYNTRPVIYATQKSYNLYIKGEFEEYDLWIRNIWTTPNLNKERNWTFWQYSNKGKLKGYEGEEEFIDLDVFNGTKAQFYEKVKSMRIKKDENVLKTIQGKITKIEEDRIYVNENKQEYKVSINEETIIENARTGKQMALSEIKQDDEIYIHNAKEKLGELILENNTFQVTRYLKGEELKKEVLEQEEIEVRIEQLKIVDANTATIIGKVTAFCNLEEYETFTVEILLDENTTILAGMKNKTEELQKMEERGDTLYIKLRENEKQQGKLVAENIEVMGC